MADGRDFVAEISNLTPQSIFIHTDQELAFRAAVTVTFFSVSFRAELAIATRDPAGWVVTFTADAETRARIEARIPEVKVLGALQPRSIVVRPLDVEVADEMPSFSSFADPEPETTDFEKATLRGEEIGLSFEQLEHIEPSSIRDALRSTGGIPTAITNPRSAETASMSGAISVGAYSRDMKEPISVISPQELLASEELPVEELESHTLPIVEKPSLDEAPTTTKARPRATAPVRGSRVRPSPATLRASVPVRPVRRRDLTKREDPPIAGVPPPARTDSTMTDMPAVNGAVLTDIPVLADDESTVVFSSPAQYLLQHRTNIAHGAIVVRSRPIPIGTEKTLHLSVPGKIAAYTLRAKVILSTDDSIGLSINEFDAHAAALEQLTR